jgi:hypothetical protein
MFTHKHHGVAQRYSWFEIKTGDVDSIQLLEEQVPLTADDLLNDERRFAQMVYVVNDSGSGGTPVDGVALETLATEANVIAQENVDNATLKQYIEEDTVTGTTWVAEALPGTALYRIKKVLPGLNGALVTTTISWAGDDDGFTHTLATWPTLDGFF